MSNTPEGMDVLLHQLMGFAGALRASEAALPDQTAADDPTGAVRASLGRSGDVVGLDVAADWSSRVDPAELGAAVVAAASATAEARVRALGDAFVAPTDLEPAGGGPQAVDLPELPDGVVVPPLEDLAERAIGALRTADAPTLDADGLAVGVGADGRVRVGLASGGLATCEVDPAWAADRTGQQLTMALDEALRGARAVLRDRAEATSRRSAELDTLLAGALAHLRLPAGGAPDQGGRDV
ncbi:hypothetical protein [Actinotalea solisilvae]|uniref:hypothetical protein n=1 Tax=Actinotalea solisilvae TaxID=2072922 RepID=UPI0018F10B75|nr:hypothetical protein [Actinotalea solisilvae]